MKKLIVFSMALLWGSFGYAEKLDLEQYQEQVRQSHEGYQGSKQKAEGAMGRSGEGALTFAPSFFTEANHMDDRRPTVSAAFQGNQTKVDKFNLGLNMQTRFGTQAKVSYLVQQTQIVGTSPALVTMPNFIDANLGLELTQSLWKNGFGRASRWQEQSMESSAKATSLNEQYNMEVTLKDTEQRFWKLATSRETVRILKETVERATHIQKWQQKRANQKLSDEADLLQANAALKMREMDLRNAENEERLARKAFNEARGKSGDMNVPETLELPVIEKSSLPNIQRAPARYDVIAAKLQVDATNAAAMASRDKQLPTLDLVGSASLNGRNPDLNQTMSNSLTTNNPLYSIGVKFAAPLDFGGVSDVRAGYQQEIKGAELTFRRKQLDQDNEWTQLSQQLEDAQERISLASDLEKAQKAKLDSERARYREGRSTTFTVVNFEQDYLLAQITRVQALSQLLNIRAQMKTFKGGAL